MLNFLRYLTLLSLVTFIASPAFAQGKQYAVLVGVENYEHPNLRTPPLKYAVEDVTELADLLAMGGYDVVLMTDDTGKRDVKLLPTRDNVNKQIEAVLEKCKKADTVVLAFAGHGLQFEGTKDAYFCPQDAKPFAEKASSLISMKKVYGELESSFAGVKLILVDACRNDPDPGRGRAGLDADAAPPPKGVGALFSCSAGQKAFEHDNLKHGVFFHYVLQGLKGDAQDKQGRVTFQGLSLYVQENVPDKVSQLFANREQLPNLRADLVGVPPVILKSVNKSSDDIVSNSIGMKLVLIPEGEFEMGSRMTLKELAVKFAKWDAKESEFEDERPPHRVRISRPFYMGQYEVMVGQFRKFVTTEGYKTEAESDGKGGWGFDEAKGEFKQDTKYSWRNPGFTQTDDHPVVNVTWSDARKFCEWLTRKESKTYRLPTEAEWEYACKARTSTLWWNGDDRERIASIGNILDETAKAKFSNSQTIDARDGHVYTAPVGMYPKNKFGLFDMHGNVSEWCEDVYDKPEYGKRSGTTLDPSVTSGSDDRVLRGGSWSVNAGYSRSAYRGRSAPGNRYMTVGFRVVR